MGYAAYIIGFISQFLGLNIDDNVFLNSALREVYHLYQYIEMHKTVFCRNTFLHMNYSHPPCYIHGTNDQSN